MLKLEHLTVSYEDDIILQDLSFEFTEGAITAITGASGIGKTTLLNTMAGLVKPSSGKVLASFKKPSYIFQEPRLFPWMTALENVKLMCSDEDKACYYLDALRLSSDVFHKYPHELSGGMKQRVSIARALAYDGDILFLDEPFKGLDAQNRLHTSRFLFDTVKGKTVLMITHDSEDTKYCDYILRMESSPVSSLVIAPNFGNFGKKQNL